MTRNDVRIAMVAMPNLRGVAMGGLVKAHAPEIRHTPDGMGADGHLMGIEAKSPRAIYLQSIG